MSLIEQILSIIAPHECLGCGQEGRLICGACLDGLTPIASRCYRCRRSTAGFLTCPGCRSQSRLSEVWAATPYRDQAKAVVHKLKFERARAGALDMASKLRLTLPGQQNWLITHVPTATSRVRQRGYDQAQLIAKELAKQLGCTYSILLARSGQGRQLGKSRAERQRQLRLAFRPIRADQVRNSAVLLIDDVLTTGATIEAAAAVLKAAGAKKVSAAVFAVA